MKEYKILVAIIGIIILGSIIFILYLLGQPGNGKDVKKYYGTWKLVSNNYIELTDVVSSDYKALEKIKINKKNLENEDNQIKHLAGCAFNIPKRDFGITTFNPKTEDCEKSGYLITTLGKLIIQDNNNQDWQDYIICFDIKGDKLIQRECSDEIKDVGITYQKIK